MSILSFLCLKEAVRKSEIQLDEYSVYQESLKSAIDWLRISSNQLSGNSTLAGDALIIAGHLECVSELTNRKEEGHTKIRDCLQNAHGVLKKSGLTGRQTVQAEVDQLQASWDKFETDLSATKGNLEKAVERWNKYDSSYHSLDNWIKTLEKSAKETLASPSDEIQAHVKICEVCLLLN